MTNQLDDNSKKDIYNNIKENKSNQSSPILYKKVIEPSIFMSQDLVKQFICPLCEGVLNDPIIPCNTDFKVYCSACIENYLKMNENKCPNCKNEIKGTPKKFDIVKASIACLETRCKNSKEGCKWTGKFEVYNEHIKKCPKEPKHCIYEGCNKIILCEMFDSHIKECPYRIVVCNKCGMKLIALEGNKHREICPKKIIDCPEKCGVRFERYKLKEHKLNCPYSLVNCPFEKIGCKEKFLRKDYEKKMNESIDKHIILFFNEYIGFKTKLSEILKMNNDDYITNNINNQIDNNEEIKK